MPARSAEHAAFGQALRERRLEVGLSQEGLADAVGLDRTYVSGIERGERNPSLTNILKLAAAVQAPPAQLFARAETLLAHPSDPSTSRPPGASRRAPTKRAARPDKA